MGPAVGGILADSVGIRAPFTLTGCAALLAAVYGFFRLPETRRAAVQEAPSFREGERVTAIPSTSAAVAVSESSDTTATRSVHAASARTPEDQPIQVKLLTLFVDLPDKGIHKDLLPRRRHSASHRYIGNPALPGCSCWARGTLGPLH